MTREFSPELGTLYAADAGGNVVPSMATQTSEAITSIAEQSAHLSMALAYYDTADLEGNYIRIAQNPSWRKAQEARQGKVKVEKILQAKIVRQQEALDHAKTSFITAFGATKLIDNELLSPTEVNELTEAEYAKFEATYRGSSPARQEKRRQVQQQLVGRLSGAMAAEPVVESTKPLFNPRAQVSLARALRADFWGLAAADYPDISDRLVTYVHPTNLLASLVHVSETSRNSLPYKEEIETRRVRTNRVTFSPAEWDLVLRATAPFYAQKAHSASAKAQRRSLSAVQDDDAPRRAEIHIIESTQSTMLAYADNALTPTLELIDRFEEAAKHNGGLARFGNEANMRAQMEYLWDFVISDMMWTVRMVQGWTHDQENMARRALEKAVFLPADTGVRRKNFALILDAVQTWTLAKQAYVRTKLAETNKFITDTETPEERAAREQALPQSA